MYQIAKRGQRVLLCGSTHVAIDNVLERIKELGLLDTIFPVRIGDAHRILDSVQKIQIDNLEAECKWDKKLLLGASNLVCGTTIGILRHPQIHERDKTAPIIPEFDYLIIDEASKTTFQEFLVPALYAKRWILIGDIRQLSPFTDREHIVGNLENIQSKSRRKDQILSKSLQRACLEIEKFYPYRNRFIIPEDHRVISHLIEELLSRMKEDEGGRQRKWDNCYFAFVDDNLKCTDLDNQICQFNLSDIQKHPLYLTAYNFVFIEKSLYTPMLLEILPANFIVLMDDNWEETSHAFRHNKLFRDLQKYRDRGRDLEDSFAISDKINDFFYEKSWAEEIAWRLIRQHELRLVNVENKSLAAYKRASRKFTSTDRKYLYPG